MSFLRQEKTVVSTERFVQVAKSQGGISVDVTHEFVDTPDIASAQVATVGDKDWQIEFDHLRQKSQASRWFSSLKAGFEAEKDTPYSTSSVSLGNFSTFSLNSKRQIISSRSLSEMLLVSETLKRQNSYFHSLEQCKGLGIALCSLSPKNKEETRTREDKSYPLSVLNGATHYS